MAQWNSSYQRWQTIITFMLNVINTSNSTLSIGPCMFFAALNLEIVSLTGWLLCTSSFFMFKFQVLEPCFNPWTRKHQFYREQRILCVINIILQSKSWRISWRIINLFLPQMGGGPFTSLCGLCYLHYWYSFMGASFYDGCCWLPFPLEVSCKVTKMVRQCRAYSFVCSKKH